jgi:hypothetical protein
MEMDFWGTICRTNCFDVGVMSCEGIPESGDCTFCEKS